MIYFLPKNILILILTGTIYSGIFLGAYNIKEVTDFFLGVYRLRIADTGLTNRWVLKKTVET